MRAIAVVTALVALRLAATPALADPPVNDNYLDSLTLGNCPPGAVAGSCLLPSDPAGVTQNVDLTQATTPANDQFIVRVRRRQEYTLQIGGQGGAGGPVSVNLVYVADRDRDDVLDINDSCPNVPARGTASGCPKKVAAVTSISTTGAGN